MIQQGDLYWSTFAVPVGSTPGYRRPVVVVQNNLFNASGIATVLVCPLTTNLRLAASRGNILLAAGEGGLSQQSVVNVSQVTTLNKTDLDDFLGALSTRRVREILAGIRIVLDPQDIP